MVVYDSYRADFLTTQINVALALFKMKVHQLFKQLRDGRLHASYKLSWTYASNVPQQCSAMGDCGVWVCKFISDLVKNLNPRVTTNPTDEAKRWRMHMVEEFYRRVEIVND